MNYKEEILNALTDVCKKARNEGYNDGCVETGKKYADIVENVRKEAYKKGVEDTWEAARKIVFQKVNLLAIFNLHWGDHSTDVLRDYSGEEAIAKLKEYETKLKEYEKEQKKDCESCFTEKLTEEKWVSAEDCKDCKQQQIEKKCNNCGQPRDYKDKCIPYKEGKCKEVHAAWIPKQDEKSCEKCMHGVRNFDTAPCYDCIKGIKDNFEPKQADATDIDDGNIKVGDEIICPGTDTHKVVLEVIEITDYTKNDSKNKQKKYRCFGETGISTEYDRPLKTGRHFHAIEYVLEELRKDKKGDEEK